MKRSPDVIVLTSGGIDSTACIHFYLEQKLNVQGLFINYGQLSNKLESYHIYKIAKYYDISLTRIKIQTNNTFENGMLVGRNALLLSYALLNSNLKNGIIAIGIHSGTGYYDCSLKFVEQMQCIFDEYTDGSIKIGSPFINFSKQDIWEYCKLNKVPTILTYSCELGLKQPCGKCRSCKDIRKIYENESKRNKTSFR